MTCIVAMWILGNIPHERPEEARCEQVKQVTANTYLLCIANYLWKPNNLRHVVRITKSVQLRWSKVMRKARPREEHHSGEVTLLPAN